MIRILSNILVIAGMLSVPIVVMNGGVPHQAGYKRDPRLELLTRFFREGNCPALTFAADFLKAADRNNLDWRLLPSISVVESGGGRVALNNNLFGWDSGRAIFTSVQAGIYSVAERLANSKLYRDKDLDEILQTYNPIGGYAALVKSVMHRISPTKEL